MIENTSNRTWIVGNGATTSIAIPFPFHAQTDLVVIETIISTGVNTVKTYGSHYSVTGAVDALGHFPTGGSVVMTTAPAVGVVITVYRDPEQTQVADLVQTGKLPVEAVIEAPLDRVTMLDIRTREIATRSIRQADGDTAAIGPLPVKAARVNKFMGFDSDGNPAMLTQPTPSLVPIAQLVGSTKAGLPAPGNVGTLYRVSDDARGVWMDTGSAWVPLNGYVINALEWMKGDGTDEHTAFQAMLDTGRPVYLPPPPVAYAVGAGLTLSTNGQLIFGAGRSSIVKALTAGFNLFTPSAPLSGIRMHDIEFHGAATSDATAQYVLFSTVANPISLSTFSRLVIYGPDANTGFNNGLLFDSASNDNRVEQCYIARLIGTSSGHGYAVQLGNADRNRILNNTFVGAVGQGRHAVYVGSGSSFNDIVGNIIVGYRQPPIVLYTLSSQTVSELNRVVGNSILGGVTSAAESGGIELDGYVQRTLVAGNIVDSYEHSGIMVSDSGQGGLTQDNVVSGNCIRNCDRFGIQLIGTKRSVVVGNTVRSNSQESAASYDAIKVSSSGSFGTEVNTDAVILQNHVSGSSHRSCIGVDSGAPAPTGTTMRGNVLLDGTLGPVTFGSTVLNGDDTVRTAPEAAASTAIAAYGYLSTAVSITVNISDPFTIENPTEARTNKALTITLRNMTGGALGVVTWGAAYKMAAWTSPASGKSRSISFIYDGTNWIETSRTPADVNT